MSTGADSLNYDKIPAMKKLQNLSIQGPPKPKTSSLSSPFVRNLQAKHQWLILKMFNSNVPAKLYTYTSLPQGYIIGFSRSTG